MTDEAQLVSAGEFGDQVKAFLENDLGQYLLSKKEIDEAEAIQELLTLDPFEYTELGTLQSKIAGLQEPVVLARKIHGYLADAIIAGHQADELLMSEEEI